MFQTVSVFARIVPPALVPALVAAWLALLSAPCPAADVSFDLDVVPILSKAGCNGGGCHGALAGKGGFRLSLFGYDPAADHLAITRDAHGRRIDLADPGTSLLLTKPTTALAHKGGKRLDVGGEDYRLLAAWIEAGCPGPQAFEKKLAAIELGPTETTAAPGQSVPLAVTAKYTDGSARDVTRWARFTSTESSRRLGFIQATARSSLVHGTG